MLKSLSDDADWEFSYVSCRVWILKNFIADLSTSF
jgi:hypothetical protein